MSKIFEALERAGEHPRHEAPVLLAPSRLRAPATSSRATLPSAFAGTKVEEEMVRLHQQIDVLLPDNAHRAIQFIGSREGEGTSTIARGFALVSATRFGRRVLLLECDRAEDRSREQPEADGTPVQVGDTTLSVGPLPRELAAASHGTDARGSASTWARLRQEYDLIVIDSQPATRSTDGLALASQVDGVLLVLEAETTRWPVAARAKQSIVRSGGRLLGVVFNKQRYYIPAFIYNWL